MTEEEFRKGKKPKSKSSRTALKDHVLCQNEYFFDIKKGDDLNELEVPKKFDDVLITEKVLKG